MSKHAVVTVLAAAGALAFAATSAKAANVGVTPTKLIVVDKGASGAKAVFVAKDLAVDKGAGIDTSTLSVIFDFTYDNGTDPPTAGEFVAAEGSANWLVNKSTVAKYVNKSAPTGGGVKVIVIKPGNLVKLVGKNLGDTPIDILDQSGAPTGTAHTAYSIGDSGSSFFTSLCSTLSGCSWKSIAGGAGAKLVCKGGAPDSSCEAKPSSGPYLSFVTSVPSGPGGAVKSGGSGGVVRKVLNNYGLNVGGGASTVAEGPIPAGGETQMNISGGPTYTVSGRTLFQTGDINNCSDAGCQYGPFLSIANAGTSTCVRNVFSSPVSGTLDSVAGTFDGSFPLTSNVFLTANGTSPCPKCLGGTPGVAGSGTCDSAWTAGTGNPYADAGAACAPTDASGDTYDCAPPPATALPGFAVDLTPITTGTASMSDPAGNFCPAQTDAGAFGCAGSGAANPICPGGNAPPAIDYIEEAGSPAGVVGGSPVAVTLASTFCIPSVGGDLGFLINAAANLPGPGATSLPGTFAIVP